MFLNNLRTNIHFIKVYAIFPDPARRTDLLLAFLSFLTIVRKDSLCFFLSINAVVTFVHVECVKDQELEHAIHYPRVIVFSSLLGVP